MITVSQLPSRIRNGRAILPTHGLAGVQPDPHRIALVAVDGERHADLYSDPVDLGAQSNLIGAPGPVSVGPIPADQNEADIFTGTQGLVCSP